MGSSGGFLVIVSRIEIEVQMEEFLLEGPWWSLAELELEARALTMSPTCFFKSPSNENVLTANFFKIEVHKESLLSLLL